MDVHEHLGALRRGLDAVVPEGLLPSDAGLLLVVGGVLGLMVGLLVAFFSKAFVNRVPKPDETVEGEQPPAESSPEEDQDAVAATALSDDDLGVALAALPTATADEQRAGAIAPEIEQAQLAAVERPIVIRPDPPKRASRFAPDPSIFTPTEKPAFVAPAPVPDARDDASEPSATGTVVDTVSVRLAREAKQQKETTEGATVTPPLRRILPKPVPADLVPASDPESPVGAGSLLGEIGGLPRVEVRAARRAAVTDSVPTPERRARESYELRARELERVAHDRLMREQQRLAASIREQLAHDKRELEAVLDNRIEDTVLRPIELPVRRAVKPRHPDVRDREGEAR
jgi:hypothetical protein